MSDVDILYEAILRKEPIVSLQTVRTVDNLLDAVYSRDPRLTGWVNGYKYTKTGVVVKKVDLELNYPENLPEKPEDVIVDADGKWGPADAYKKPNNPPRILHVVTKDLTKLRQRITEDNATLGVVCPGYQGTNMQMQEKPAANGYYRVAIELLYLYDQATYDMYWAQTERKMMSICKQFFGDETVHKVVKTFLAFSYLQQHCEYDDQAYECIKNDRAEEMDHPWVVLPFGPIERNLGICCGIAHAMHMFLNFFGVKNQIISGRTGEGDDAKLHAWNLVEFAGKYYHVDATAGVSGSSVYIGCFMKNDAEMRQTHYWDENNYPAATGKRFTYDFIEMFIEEHEGELLDAGVDERYLFPADITE